MAQRKVVFLEACQSLWEARKHGAETHCTVKIATVVHEACDSEGEVVGRVIPGSRVRYADELNDRRIDAVALTAVNFGDEIARY